MARLLRSEAVKGWLKMQGKTIGIIAVVAIAVVAAICSAVWSWKRISPKPKEATATQQLQMEFQRALQGSPSSSPTSTPASPAAEFQRALQGGK